MSGEGFRRTALRWFRVESDSELLLVRFATRIGYCGAMFRGDRIIRSTLGHADEDSLLRYLLAHSNSPPNSLADLLDDPAERSSVPTLRLRMVRSEARDAERRSWAERFRGFFENYSDDLTDLPLDFAQTTEFQRRTLEACRKIPPGETCTYAELARLAGSPGAARAVGNVMANNHLAPLIPCHRVVGSHGHLGGYSAPTGLTLKRRLLALEAQAVASPSAAH